MSKDERILRKVGKLLEIYGVKPEEKEKFLLDLQDKKYDEEEETTSADVGEKEEEVAEEKVEEKDSTEVEEGKDESKEVTEEGEEKEEVETEEDKVEETEQVENSDEEEKVEGEEEKAEETTETEEGKEEETTEEKSQFDYQAEINELKKANDGLSARVKSLEDIVAELGVDVDNKEDKVVGATPKGNAIDQNYDSTFDEINRKRVGF